MRHRQDAARRARAAPKAPGVPDLPEPESGCEQRASAVGRTLEPALFATLRFVERMSRRSLYFHRVRAATLRHAAATSAVIGHVSCTFPEREEPCLNREPAESR